MTLNVTLTINTCLYAKNNNLPSYAIKPQASFFRLSAVEFPIIPTR